MDVGESCFALRGRGGRSSRGGCWQARAPSPEPISSLTDPIRSRTFFLDMLSVAQRATYLDKLVLEMECYLEKTKEHLNDMSQKDDPLAYFGAVGAVKITEARLEWVQQVRKALQ